MNNALIVSYCYNLKAKVVKLSETPKKRAKKNGVPPYTNLVNLKSNTMKNTLQRYDISRNLQTFLRKNSVKQTIS